MCAAPTGTYTLFIYLSLNMQRLRLVIMFYMLDCLRILWSLTLTGDAVLPWQIDPRRDSIVDNVYNSILYLRLNCSLVGG